MKSPKMINPKVAIIVSRCIYKQTHVYKEIVWRAIRCVLDHVAQKNTNAIPIAIYKTILLKRFGLFSSVSLLINQNKLIIKKLANIMK
jgi:hypothetical protein